MSSIPNGRPLDVQVAVLFERLEAVRQELAELKAATLRVEDQIQKLNGRVTEWEKWQAGVMGKASLLSAAVTLVLNIFGRSFFDRLNGK